MCGINVIRSKMKVQRKGNLCMGWQVEEFDQAHFSDTGCRTEYFKRRGKKESDRQMQKSLARKDVSVKVYFSRPQEGLYHNHKPSET